MTAPSPLALAGGRRAALQRRADQRRAWVGRLQRDLAEHRRGTEEHALCSARLAFARRQLTRAERQLAAVVPVDTPPARRRVRRLTRVAA